jgi:hypothetical protein
LIGPELAALAMAPGMPADRFSLVDERVLLHIG